MRDLRLYYYGNGQLYKLGHTKKTHKFTTLKDCRERIKWLNSKNYVYQYVIIEYFGTHNSRIIEII